MAYLALVNALLALCMVVWVSALSRRRGGDIPCTPRIFAWTPVAVGVIAMVGIVVANVLALKALDDAFGKKLSPVIFTVWLLAMSAAAILFIVAITTLHTNRTAAAWIRVVPPDGLLIRVGSEAKTLKLEPGSVRVQGMVEGVGGMMYVQYLVRDGARAIDLVVPFTRDAAVEGAPWLGGIHGLVVQGAGRALHRHFAPYLDAVISARAPSGSTDGPSE